jgi:hypothetical protein
MPDYSASKIYKIKPKSEHPQEDEYIGSTTKKYLSSRLSGHRYDYTTTMNGGSVDALFNLYGADECEIELIEEYPCNSKKELLEREGHWIKTQPCINQKNAGVNRKEYNKKKWKNYYTNNSDRLKKKSLEYYHNKKNNIV